MSDRRSSWKSIGLPLAAVISTSLVPPACSLIVDRDTNQCSSDSDCTRFAGTYCDLANNVCSASSTDSGPPDGSPGQCTLAHPPGAPSGQYGGASAELMFVIDHIEQGDVDDPDGTPGYEKVGWDLDNLCTVGDKDRACMPPSWVANDPTDGLDGRDNGIGNMLYHQAKFLGASVLTSAQMNADVQTGKSPPAALLTIRSYNNFPDDDQVEVHWFKPSLTTDTGTFIPRWDGTDAWPVDPDSVDSVGLPDGGESDAQPPQIVSRFIDTHAYVSNYVLVASFPGPLPMVLRNVTYVLNDVIVEGTLTPDAAVGWRIKSGVFASRMTVHNVLASIADYSYVQVGVPLCRNDPNFPVMLRMVCSYVDLPEEGPADITKACQATSTGLRITALLAKPGFVAPASSHLHPCAAGNDPVEVDCSTPSGAP